MNDNMREKKSLNSLELSIRTLKPRTVPVDVSVAKSEQTDSARVVVVTTF